MSVGSQTYYVNSSQLTDQEDGLTPETAFQTLSHALTISNLSTSIIHLVNAGPFTDLISALNLTTADITVTYILIK